MTFLDSIILGIIQGFTEFLPISSSGHLVLGQRLLNLNMPGNQLEVVMHMGTLLSILVVFWNDILSILKSLLNKETQRYVLTIVFATIPAIIVGLGFKDQIEVIFDSVILVGVNLCVTGIFLWLTKYLSRMENKISMKRGILVGIIQAIAILPGISRSGSTISMALFLKISQKEAAKFSFLLAIPALAGAGILTAIDGMNSNDPSMSILPLAAGFISSFIVGWISLKWLMKLLKQGQFHWFGIYCFIIGLLTILFA